MSPARRARGHAAVWRAAALCVALAAIAAARGESAAAGDAEVQAQLRRVAEAIVAGTNDAAARIDRLTQLAPSRAELLLEIAVFLRDARGTEEAMSGALVLEHLAFTNAETMAAVVPRLDTTDAALRRVLYDLLGTVDRPAGGEPEFGAYLTLLRGDSPPPGLVRYLYAISPGAAVSAMRRAHPSVAASGEDRDVDAVEAFLRSQARGASPTSTASREPAASFERLSRSPVWWLRLYAAAVLGEEPELAGPEVKARLAADAHPLVRDPGHD